MSAATQSAAIARARHPQADQCPDCSGVGSGPFGEWDFWQVCRSCGGSGLSQAADPHDPSPTPGFLILLLGIAIGGTSALLLVGVLRWGV